MFHWGCRMQWNDYTWDVIPCLQWSVKRPFLEPVSGLSVLGHWTGWERMRSLLDPCSCMMQPATMSALNLASTSSPFIAANSFPEAQNHFSPIDHRDTSNCKQCHLMNFDGEARKHGKCARCTFLIGRIGCFFFEVPNRMYYEYISIFLWNFCQ